MKARIFFTVCIIAALLVACAPAVTTETAPAVEEKTPVAEEVTATEGKQIKLAYLSPDPIGIDEFLVMGKKGIEALGQKYNAEIQVMEGETADPTSNENNVRAAISWDADVVILITWKFNDIVTKVAAEYPDQQFLIIDSCIPDAPENVSCAQYKEYQTGYLLGAIAGSLTETNKVGVVGALDIPFLHRYTDTYVNGAKAVNPDVETQILWIGGDAPFFDPAKAKELALQLANQGYDYIFSAGAGSDYGVLEAAKESGLFKAFAVDINQCANYPGFVVENLIKRVDNTMIAAVDDILAGKRVMTEYGIDGKITGLVYTTSDDPANSQCLFNDYPEVIEKVMNLRDQIISGELVIPDPAAAQ